MKVEGLLLDLDRTLVDVQTYTDYEEACRALDDELGAVDLIDVPESGWRSATHRAMATLSSLAPDPDSWTRADRIITGFEADAVSRKAVAMPHLSEFLIHTSGTPSAVVTLMGQRAAEAACERFGVEVETVIGRARGLLPKPEPDQLVLALDRLGVHSSVAVMVGDSPWDEVAARSAGVGFIGVTNGGESVFEADVTVVEDLSSVAAMLSQ